MEIYIQKLLNFTIDSLSKEGIEVSQESRQITEKSEISQKSVTQPKSKKNVKDVVKEFQKSVLEIQTVKK